MKKRMECHIIGRVQMVMYRDFARRAARARGITGFVRNEDDSSVAVVAEGEDAALRSYVEELHGGSMLSRVDAVDVTWKDATEEFKDFIIQR